MLVLVYVDDILVSGASSTSVQHVITALQNQFALKALGPMGYFLGSDPRSLVFVSDEICIGHSEMS